MSDSPIEVKENALPEVAMTALRYATTALAVVATNQGLVDKDKTATVAGALLGLATAGWALYRTWVTHRKLVVTANAAPNDVAQVKP